MIDRRQLSNSCELRLIFQHVVVAVAIAAGVWMVSQAFIWLVPDVKDIAYLIDQLVFLGILVIIGIKLIFAFVRGDGMHAFAVA